MNVSEECITPNFRVKWRGDKILQNVFNHLQDHMVSQPRRPWSVYSIDLYPLVEAILYFLLACWTLSFMLSVATL
jgi:hypothetical protein